MLKRHLENPRLRKYMWDGRSDCSELHHGHGIVLNGVANLQLVYLHLTKHQKKLHRLTSMLDESEALETLPEN
jgi:hypothetical protein